MVWKKRYSDPLTESWKPIPDFSEYELSSLGNVRRVVHKTIFIKTRANRLMVYKNKKYHNLSLKQLMKELFDDDGMF